MNRNKSLIVITSLVLGVCIGCGKSGESVPSADEYRAMLKQYQEAHQSNGGFSIDINKEVDAFNKLPPEGKRERMRALWP